MTKEEAIQRLVDLQDGSGQAYEAIRMAIESLSADVVSRDEYIKLLEESIWKSEQIGKLLEYQTEAADRPKGEWIDREDSTDLFFLYKYECSVCGGKNVFNSSYCPNCGAHMR